jgi:hypothetical protein
MKGLARLFTAALGIVAVSAPTISMSDIDRTAVDFIAPEDIKFVRNAAGTSEQAVLFGDPSKPGPYVIRLRWLPGNMSRPHFHSTDRFFIVLEGTRMRKQRGGRHTPTPWRCSFRPKSSLVKGPTS